MPSASYWIHYCSEATNAASSLMPDFLFHLDSVFVNCCPRSWKVNHYYLEPHLLANSMLQYFAMLTLKLLRWFLHLHLRQYYLTHSENIQSFLRCFFCCKLINSYFEYLQLSYFLSNDETFLFLLKFCLNSNLMSLLRCFKLTNEY